MPKGKGYKGPVHEAVRASPLGSIAGKKRQPKKSPKAAPDRAGTAKGKPPAFGTGPAHRARAIKHMSRTGGSHANALAATIRPSYGKGFTGRKLATTKPKTKKKK